MNIICGFNFYSLIINYNLFSFNILNIWTKRLFLPIVTKLSRICHEIVTKLWFVSKIENVNFFIKTFIIQWLIKIFINDLNYKDNEMAKSANNQKRKNYTRYYISESIIFISIQVKKVILLWKINSEYLKIMLIYFRKLGFFFDKLKSSLRTFRSHYSLSEQVVDRKIERLISTSTVSNNMFLMREEERMDEYQY